jgi:hypothetical protein
MVPRGYWTKTRIFSTKDLEFVSQNSSKVIRLITLPNKPKNNMLALPFKR